MSRRLRRGKGGAGQVRCTNTSLLSVDSPKTRRVSVDEVSYTHKASKSELACTDFAHMSRLILRTRGCNIVLDYLKGGVRKNVCKKFNPCLHLIYFRMCVKRNYSRRFCEHKYCYGTICCWKSVIGFDPSKATMWFIINQGFLLETG